MIQRVNLDFDQALAKNMPSYRKPKALWMFEYVFFIVNKCSKNSLLSLNDYSENYLSYLRTKGFVIPDIVKDGPYENWWGNLEDFGLCRKLNSKIWTTKWALDKKLCPQEVEIITNKEELKEVQNKFREKRMYYRSEYGFSGVTNKLISHGQEYSLRYPGTLLEYLDVVLNFGVTVDLASREYFICKNNIDSNGVFLGGEIIELSCVEAILGRNIKAELADLFTDLQQVCGDCVVEFDSLLFKDSHVKWYKVVEINYRKTMGLVVHSLYSRFGKGEWIIERNNFNVQSVEEIEAILSQSTNKKVVITSPVNRPLISYYTFD